MSIARLNLAVCRTENRQPIVINLTVNVYERGRPRYYYVEEEDEKPDDRTVEQRMADLERDLTAMEKRIR